MPPRSAASPLGDRPDAGSEPAPGTPGAGFLPRLDYYLKLADGPVLPDDASPEPDAGSNGPHWQTGDDTPMAGSHLDHAESLNQTQTAEPLQPEPGRPDSSIGVRLHESPNVRSAFYGPTSLLHMYASTMSPWTPDHPPLALRQPLLPPEKHVLEKRLTDHYFEYDNILLDGFTQDLYLHEKQAFESGEKTQVYSPALGHAMQVSAPASLTGILLTIHHKIGRWCPLHRRSRRCRRL